MDNDLIICTLKNPHSNSDSLRMALEIVRLHIDYCNHYNIDMLSDPLLARALKWR